MLFSSRFNLNLHVLSYPLLCRYYYFSPVFYNPFSVRSTPHLETIQVRCVNSELTKLLVVQSTRFCLALSRFCSLFLVFFACFLLTLSRFFACFRSLFWQAFTLKKAGNLHLTPLFSFSVPSGLQSFECCEENTSSVIYSTWFHRFIRSS